MYHSARGDVVPGNKAGFIAISAMRIPVQWVPPTNKGGIAAVYRPNDEVSSMQMEPPRMELALASWVAPVDLPEDDFILAHRTSTVRGFQEGRFSNGSSMDGSRPTLSTMQMGLERNGVPADLRTFAAVTGLRSYLITAPNDSVEVILSQVSVPDSVLVFPVLVLAYLWVVGRVILDFVQSNPKKFTVMCTSQFTSFFFFGPGRNDCREVQNHDVHNPKCLQISLIIPILGPMYAICPCNWLILELDLALTLLH